MNTKLESEHVMPGPDLAGLAIDRSPTEQGLRPRSRWLVRYALPMALIAAFGGLFAWSARESLLPAREVTITPVLVTKASSHSRGTPLFQAVGWVEPRPSAVVISSFASGVIQDLMLVEGQSVESGEPIARLLDSDARLALQNAQADLQLREAEVKQAEAARTAARVNLENPAALQAALAEAEALASGAETQLDAIPIELDTARQRQQLAEENLAHKETAGNAISGKLLRQARAELATARNQVQTLEARQPALKDQAASWRRKCTALARQLELRTDQKRAVAESNANLAAAQARRQQAQLAVQATQLTLDRMTVRAPISGRVLSVDARPGQRLVGPDAESEHGSGAIATLYDPASLQVRVDVRLEDIPQVNVDQAVKIETAACPAAAAGQVLSITTRADIQKNTLQVKVAILDPPEVLKPEMLAKVTFLAAAPRDVAKSQVDHKVQLFVPEALVVSADSDPFVWVADLSAGIARRQGLKLGPATENGLVEVQAGLSPFDKVIVEGRADLRDGARIRCREST